MARQSLTMFIVIMNNCHIEIDAHRLSDGGLLLSYGGNSYTTYMKEEFDRYMGGWGGRDTELCFPTGLKDIKPALCSPRVLDKVPSPVNSGARGAVNLLAGHPQNWQAYWGGSQEARF